MVNGKQEGKPNHFIVITLYQQQPSDFTYSLIKKNLGILNTKIISWNWKLVIQFWHSAFKRLHWAFKTAPLSVNEMDLWWIFNAFWPKNSARKVLSQSQINNRGRYSICNINQQLTVCQKMLKTCFINILVMKDFFWDLIMIIYGNLICIKKWKISLDEIIELTFRFSNGRWF